MKIRTKIKETYYARKKLIIAKKCCKCNSLIVLENMYIGHNHKGNYNCYFCTDCIQSLDVAKREALVY